MTRNESSGAPEGERRDVKYISESSMRSEGGAVFEKGARRCDARRRHLYMFHFVFCLLSAVSAHAEMPTDYPVSASVRVGQCYARVSPALAMPVETPMQAPAKLKLTGRSEFFKKGRVWGVIDEDRIAVEKQRLELARAQLRRKETNDADSGLAKAELERRLQEIDTNLAAIDSQDDSALADIEGGEKFREQLRRRTAEAKASLLKQKDLLTSKLVGLDGERAEELQNLRLTLRGKEMEFSRLDEAAHLTMPCDGVVTLLIDPNPKGEYTLRPGHPFAVIEDRSRYLIRVPVGAQPWRVLPPARLGARVRSGDRTVVARWCSSETTKDYGRDELVYVFEVEKDSAPFASGLAGGSALAEVVYETESPVRLVPKLVFASVHPEAFKDGADWAAAVRKVWPGYRLAIEGAGELGVVADTIPSVSAGSSTAPPSPSGGGLTGLRRTTGSHEP